MNLSELKSSEHNPRKISGKQLARLRKSIEEFGDLSGIIYNRRTGTLIGGHQRIKVMPKDAQILKNDLTAPSRAGTVSTGTIEIDGESFIYREVDWDFDRERMANIAANKHAGEWDEDKLTALLAELTQLPDFDIDLIGFENTEMEALLDIVIEDEFDAAKEYESIVEPRTRRGDIYQLGPHSLMCGDSRSPEDVEILISKDKARLVFTDPPYNIDYKDSEGSGIFNDNLSEEECLNLFTDVLLNLQKNTTDDAAIYWWFATSKHHLNVEAFKTAKWHISQVIIWLKNSMVLARGQDYHRLYEPCIVGWKKGKTRYRNRNITDYKDVFNLDFDDFVEMFDVWYEKRDATANYVHPTQKPVRLAERGIKKHSEIGDIVIDLFGGSGSTLIACDQMKRRARLMEMDPKYCDVIINRYVKYSGKSEVLLNGDAISWK